MIKRRILVWVQGSIKWIGGIYYTRNLLFQLSMLEKARDKYKIYLCTDTAVLKEFEGLQELLDIHIIERTKEPEQILQICDEYEIDVILPMQKEPYDWLILDRCVYWIPDFQEVHLPNNFAKKELINREKNRGYIAEKHKSLILSSYDAYKDYCKLYPQFMDNVFVVHFVSYIEKILEKIDADYTQKVLEKYNIDYEYLYIANQFWKHKNHIVVLKAMNRIIEKGHHNIHLICTGFMGSYGDKMDEYVQMLLDYVTEHKLHNNVHFLGLVNRDEQLCIMQNANLLVQPSMFEGWGCSVEDAKVMGKRVLLSDIAVHREQKNEKTILFETENDEQLADIIIEQFACVEKSNLLEGQEQTYMDATCYAHQLDKAISVISSENKFIYMDKLMQLREEKISALFSGVSIKEIGIYGTGIHTEGLLESCKKVLKEEPIIFFDSDESKWGKKYNQGFIYSPDRILETGVKRIIISSYLYQDEMFCGLKQYKDMVEVRKIYDTQSEIGQLWA